MPRPRPRWGTRTQSRHTVIDHGEEYTDPNLRFELYETNSQRAKLVEIWEKRDVIGKQELQNALCPDGLVWDGKKGFLNSQNDVLNLIQEWFAQNPPEKINFS